MPNEDDQHIDHSRNSTLSQNPGGRSRASSGQYMHTPFEPSGSQLAVMESPMEYSNPNYATFPTPGQNQFGQLAPDLMNARSELSMADAYGNSAQQYSPFVYPDAIMSDSMSRDTNQHGVNAIDHTYPGTSASGYHRSDMNIGPTPGWMADPGQVDMAFKTRNGQKVMQPLTPTQQPPYRYAASAGASSRGTYPYDRTFSDPGVPSTPRTDPDVLNSPSNVLGPQGEVANQFDSLTFSNPTYSDIDVPASNSSSNSNSNNHDIASRVQQRHNTNRKKEHWCDIKPCLHKRPFGTRNDLERHKLSVHKIAAQGQKVYICQGQSCLAAGKSRGWPRKDNFKNHCKVAHPDEELDDLLRRSENASLTLSLPSPEVTCNDVADEADESKHHPLHVSIPTSGNARSPPIYLTPTKEEYSPQQHIPSPQDHRSLSPASRFARPVKQLSPDQQSPQTGDMIFGQPLSETDCGRDIERELAAISKKASLETRIILHSLIRKRPNFDLSQLGDDESGPQHVCKKCSKPFARACDLKKHAERHTRRWGCTSSDCNKRFGSKNDWKRHENLVHFQQEIWVCGEAPLPYDPPKLGQKRCVFVCTKPRDFRRHLGEKHKIFRSQRAKYLEKQENERRVGRNCAGTMWCGFCEKVIKLWKLDAKQWEERFDHIDQHFKKGLSIDQWYPPDSSVPKGQIRLPSSPEPASMDDFDTSSHSDTSSLGSGHDDDVIPIDPALLLGAETRESGQRSPKRRAIMGNTPSQWLCCDCNQVIMNSAIDTNCCLCGHRGSECENCQNRVIHERESSAVVSECDASVNPLLGD